MARREDEGAASGTEWTGREGKEDDESCSEINFLSFFSLLQFFFYYNTDHWITKVPDATRGTPGTVEVEGVISKHT